MLLGALLGLGLLFIVAFTSDTELTKSIFAIALMLVGVPVGIVCFIDLVVGLKASGRKGRSTGVLAFVASAPVLLLGLVSIIFGLAIIAAVLFNQFVERQPGVSGVHLLFPLGIGPSLVAVGWCWIKIARARKIPESEYHHRMSNEGIPIEDVGEQFPDTRSSSRSRPRL